MDNNDTISRELLFELEIALANREYWLAVNARSYYLKKDDVFFFKSKDEAEDFSENNISDRDHFRVIEISSLHAMQNEIFNGKTANEQLKVEKVSVKNDYSLSILKEQNIKTIFNEIINNKIFVTNQSNFMNEKNYEYLTDQLKRTGFGDTLNGDLRKNMEKQNREFALNFGNSYGNDKVAASLHFKKSDQFDMYFFNKYDLQLNKKESDDTMKQTFYSDKGITLKEGYNLLDGRSVNKTLLSKEGEKYKAWLQLDFNKNTQNGNHEFKQYHQNWGFDLEKALSKYPIKELNNETYKTNLIKSLERGNLQSATFQINGKEEKIYLASLPAFKSLSAFDSTMTKIKLSDLLQNQKQQQSTNQDNKLSVFEKQTVNTQTKIETNKEKPVQKKSKRQKVA